MPAKKAPIIKKVSPTKKPMSELSRYVRTAAFSALTFGLTYGYTSWMKIPNQLNKSVADTAIILIGLSMVMSSVGYFWNRFDHLVIFRKHLGLVGFAYGVAHWLLSWGLFLSVLKAETWQKGAMWPAFTGVVALVIFTIMALISNQFSARLLGGKWWRFILRTGYAAVLLVAAHVVLLKGPRWITWYEGGMKTPPSMSLMVTVFMAVVVLMRVALWWSIKQQKANVLKKR